MKKIKMKLYSALALTSTLTILPIAVSCKNDNNTTYTITFDCQGGSNVESIQVNSGSTIIEPDTPIFEHHIFGGWYTDKQCQYKYNFALPVESSFTLYAKWDNISKGVSEQEWNNAFDYLINRDEQTKYIAFASSTQPRITDMLYAIEGFNEWHYADNSEIVLEANQTHQWAYKYSYSTTGIEKSFTTQFCTDISSLSILASIINLLKKLRNDDEYSYASKNWYFDETTGEYFARKITPFLTNIKIKFNDDKKIKSVEVFSDGYATPVTYSAQFIYDDFHITIPKEDSKGKVVINFDDKQAPDGLTIDEPIDFRMVEFDTSSFSVNIKSTSTETQNYKIVLNITEGFDRHDEDDLLVFTGSIVPNETKEITFDITQTTHELWKDIGFLGRSCHVYLEKDGK